MASMRVINTRMNCLKALGMLNTHAFLIGHVNLAAGTTVQLKNEEKLLKGLSVGKMCSVHDNTQTHITRFMRLHYERFTLHARNKFCLPNFAKTFDSQPLARSTSHALHHSRQVHSTSTCLRKRKAKPTPHPTLHAHSTEELGPETDVEYSDEAVAYANELTERGHRTLQGHCVLVIEPMVKGAKTMGHKLDHDLKLAEAEALIKTLQNWSVFESKKVTAKSLTKKYVFGEGTFVDLSAQIRSQPGISAVFLILDRLSGVQKKALQEEWGVPVLDRFEVVLQIFKEHASSKEAKLQIALAELHFRKAHLHQDVENLDQQGGAQHYIGGSGETLLEKKQRQLRDKEGVLRKALDKVRRKRQVLRESRQKKHFPHVAVVGYTNAGKTSLIKALTGDTKLTPKDQLFATLDVTSHGGYLSSGLPVIYTDTVGFISDLPHQLVASFAATLEDVVCADLILLVCDVSHPDSVSHRVNVMSILNDLGVGQSLLDNLIEVHNKIDLLPDRTTEDADASIQPVSAVEGTGLNRLKEEIEDKLMTVTGRVRCELRIPQGGQQLSWLYKEATIEEISTVDEDPEHLVANVIFSSASYSRFCAKFGDLRLT